MNTTVTSKSKIFLSEYFLGNQTFVDNCDSSAISDRLPVQLIYFNGSALADRILLKWGTATEINNYGFDIEKTIYPNLAWETIGFVFGNGNSNSPKHYTFEDTIITMSGTYIYRLKQIDTDGAYEYSDTIHVHFGLTDLVENHATLPSPSIELSQNFPNPFNPITNIKIKISHKTLSTPSDVVLSVYNAVGDEIERIYDGKILDGEFLFQFNGANLSTGVYFLKLDVGNQHLTKKMILLR